jgi:hypothetical protein
MFDGPGGVVGAVMDRMILLAVVCFGIVSAIAIAKVVQPFIEAACGNC